MNFIARSKSKPISFSPSMFKIVILGLIISLCSSQAFSQEKFTISGTLSDVSNGEELIGASIYVKELGNGATTNVYGFFSLTLPAGTYNIDCKYVGYETLSKNIVLEQNVKLDLELKTSNATLDEVIITGKAQDENVTSTQMSVNTIETKELETIPVILGEKDVIKTIQLLPGIKSSEGGGGFFVRGGSSDQNLLLLDEAPVYNASHLLGFFSVFNSDAIKGLTIYKGHIPAEFGGRASSVLDIKMNDGNNKKFNASAGIGLISSKATLEGPIVKDKGSFIVSARRTYLDVFLNLSNNEDIKNSSLFFYDLNAKVNYKLGENNRVYLSGYLGRDKFGFSDVFGFNWGNKTFTTRWNHIFSNKLFLNSTLLFSDYNYEVNINGEEGADNGFKIISAIQDYSIKEDFTYYVNPKNTIKFGVNGIYHKFVPGEIRTEANSATNEILLQEKFALEGAVYISDDIKVSKKVNINTGLRYSYFAQIGPGDIFTYDTDGDVASTENFKKGETVKTYDGLEPRFGVTYILNETSSVKASAGRNQQYLHLVSNSTSGTPIDLWIPSTNNVKPQIADQIALGYFRNFNDNAYESSVEVYYKDMQNQVDYKTGAQLIFNENVESQLLFGDGYSYGTELFVKKKKGDLTGWISYTISKTERKFDDIDFGQAYSTSWDRTHDLSVVGIYKLNKKWTLSSAFVFQTGNAITYPIGKYDIEGQTVFRYGKRNADRLPNYHRLDLGATKQVKSSEKFESSLTFSLYNAYGRKNAFSVAFRDNADDPTQTEAVKTTLFTFVPSITYSIKFK